MCWTARALVWTVKTGRTRDASSGAVTAGTSWQSSSTGRSLVTVSTDLLIHRDPRSQQPRGARLLS